MVNYCTFRGLSEAPWVSWSTAGGVTATTDRDSLAYMSDESAVDGGVPSPDARGSAFSRGNQGCRKGSTID
jgi:hypothetical protein